MKNADTDAHADGCDQGESQGKHELLEHGDVRGEFACSGAVLGGRNASALDRLVRIREDEVVVAVFVVVAFLGSMGNDLSGGGDFSGWLWLGVVVRMTRTVTVAVNAAVGGGSAGVTEGGDAGAKSDAFEHLVENNDGKQGAKEGITGDDYSEADKKGVEDDAGFKNGDVDHVGFAWGRALLLTVAGNSLVGLLLGLVPLDETNAKILDEEGEEDACHEDGRGCGFVLQLAEAFVLEH